MKAVVADVFAFFEGGVVALVAFAAVEFFESVAFALLFVVGLVRFADWKAFFDGLIVFLVVFARDAFRYIRNVVSVLGTGFALVSELVPHRSQFRTRLAAAGCPIH